MSRRAIAAGVMTLVLAAVVVPPAAATPPGRNGMLVWQQESRNTFPRLVVANADGSGLRRVFDSSGRRGEFEATFSPTDPNVLFFSRFTLTPFSEDLVRGDLTTGAVTRIRRAKSADIAPTVSPDGTRLVYFAIPQPRRLNRDIPPPPERVHVINVDGTDDRAITPRRRRSFDPDWSPDGSRIVYCEVRFLRSGDAQNRLMVMNADGSGRDAITAFGGRNEINPKWMPDGQTIVFEQFHVPRTRSDLATVDPDGGPTQTLLATRAWETNPVPSPDGTRILFTSDRDRRGPRRLGPGFELYTMGTDGSDIVRVTNNRVADIFPDWQRLP